MKVGKFGVFFASLALGFGIFVAVFRADLIRILGLMIPFGVAFPENVYNESLAIKNCQFLDRALFGCESGAAVGNFAYFACSHKRSRMRWYPSLFHLAKEKKLERDSIYTFNLKEKKLRLLSLENFENNVEIVLSGLSAIQKSPDSSTNVVSVINHRRDKTCVEIFTHDVVSYSLVFLKNVCDPLLLGSTGIALFDPSGSFFATVPAATSGSDYHLPTPPLLLKALFNRDTDGKLVFHAGGKKASALRVVRKRLSYPLDVVRTSGGQSLYVLEGGTGRVLVFDIASLSDGNVRESRLMKTIQLPHLARRLYVSSDAHNAGEIYAAATLRGLDVLFWSRTDYLHHVPSLVIAVRNNTSDESRFYGHPYLTERILIDTESRYLNMATMAVVGYNEDGIRLIFVGGPMMQGLVQCSV